jgi:uncharacterized protein YggE
MLLHKQWQKHVRQLCNIKISFLLYSFGETEVFAMDNIKFFLLLLLVLSPFAWAEQPTRLIAVQGESKVELEPNRAILSLEVKQTRITLDEARQGVGTSLKNAVAVLNKYGISDKNIEKTQVWQGPNYQWENNKQVLRGYNASVQIKATLDDLAQLAKLVDALASVKDVALQNTGFTRSDEEALQSERRKHALLNAKQKASEMLAVYNEKLGPVLTIRDSGSPQPMVYGKMEMRAMSMQADTAPEPASWAKVTIEANVQVEFAIQ